MATFRDVAFCIVIDLLNDDSCKESPPHTSSFISKIMGMYMIQSTLEEVPRLTKIMSVQFLESCSMFKRQHMKSGSMRYN